MKTEVEKSEKVPKHRGVKFSASTEKNSLMIKGVYTYIKLYKWRVTEKRRKKLYKVI